MLVCQQTFIYKNRGQTRFDLQKVVCQSLIHSNVFEIVS